MDKDSESVIIYDEDYVQPNPNIKDVAIGIVVTSILLLILSIFILSSLNPYPNPVFGSIVLIISIIFGILSICLFVKYYKKS